MADSFGYLYTVGGYATLIGLGYVIYQVSIKKSKKRVVTTSAKTAQPELRKEEKKKKQRLESFVLEAQESSKQAAQPETQEKQEGTPEAKPWAKEDKEGLDNREFAKQLAKVQEGHKFASKSEESKQREKSVKQSRANKIKAPEVQSAPSSNGADADDDASPANSPETRAVDASGVADMLEPAPAGPSVLRLTDSGSKKPKKTAKAPEPVETKKQRQNRKKAEAAKASREEAERERKILEEKQRRTARIAEGRSAKDGSEFTAANGINSAWTEITPSGADTEKTDDSNLYEPLDTFEEKPVSVASAAKKEPSPKQESSWISSLPSEEEQMEMLREESDEWSTVKTKSKKSKKAPSSTESGDEVKTSQPHAQPKQVAAAGSARAAKAAPATNFGSFSALTVKDDSAEDLEEEWEV